MPTRTKRSSRNASRARSTQPSRDSGNFTNVLETAREHPFTTAAAAGAVGALAAGAFLWSRRDQIGDQFNHLIENFRSGQDHPELAEAVSATQPSARGGTGSGRGRVRAVRTSEMS
jgi:hypothetical protein